VTGQRFSPGAQVSFANKTDHHNVSEIFLKVAMMNKKKKKVKLSHIGDVKLCSALI
jgi:hypothetical protein